MSTGKPSDIVDGLNILDSLDCCQPCAPRRISVNDGRKGKLPFPEGLTPRAVMAIHEHSKRTMDKEFSFQEFLDETLPQYLLDRVLKKKKAAYHNSQASKPPLEWNDEELKILFPLMSLEEKEKWSSFSSSSTSSSSSSVYPLSSGERFSFNSSNLSAVQWKGTVSAVPLALFRQDGSEMEAHLSGAKRNLTDMHDSEPTPLPHPEYQNQDDSFQDFSSCTPPPELSPQTSPEFNRRVFAMLESHEE